MTRVGDRTLTLTNLDKVLYPATGYTKAEVIDYYLHVAPTMLPYVADRALTRLRFPDGVGAIASPSTRRTRRWELRPGYAGPRSAPATERIDYVVADDSTDPGLAGQPGGPGAARAAVDDRQRDPPDGVVDLPQNEPRAASRWPTGWWSTSTRARG